VWFPLVHRARPTISAASCLHAVFHTHFRVCKHTRPQVGTETGSQTNNMFTLWIDHGDAPSAGGSGGSYAYAIWPDAPSSAFTGGVWRDALSRFDVLENSNNIQAVFDTAMDVLYAAIYAGNSTALALPPSLRAVSITVPWPAGISVSVLNYTANASSGAKPVLAVAFSRPEQIVTLTDVRANAGHSYHYTFNVELHAGQALVSELVCNFAVA
jgi:hypothetical protein